MHLIKQNGNFLFVHNKYVESPFRRDGWSRTLSLSIWFVTNPEQPSFRILYEYLEESLRSQQKGSPCRSHHVDPLSLRDSPKSFSAEIQIQRREALLSTASQSGIISRKVWAPERISPASFVGQWRDKEVARRQWLPWSDDESPHITFNLRPLQREREVVGVWGRGLPQYLLHPCWEAPNFY